MNEPATNIAISRLGPFLLIAIECDSEREAADLLQLLTQDRRLSALLYDLLHGAAARLRH